MSSFTHASDQGYFLRLAGRQQPLVEVADDGIENGSRSASPCREHPEPGSVRPRRRVGLARCPLSRLKGATPTKAAICRRSRVPNSGRSASRVRESCSPHAGKRCAEGRPSRAILDFDAETALTPCPSRSTPVPTRRYGLRCGDGTALMAVPSRFFSETSMVNTWRLRAVSELRTWLSASSERAHLRTDGVGEVGQHRRIESVGLG